MDLDLLTAISPIDGRYRGKTEQLANYFSEYALIRYRVRVEIEYFITLCELPLPQLASFDKQLFERLRDIYRNLDEKGAQRVKDIGCLQGVYPLRSDFSGHQQHQCTSLSKGGSGRVLLPTGRGVDCTAPDLR